MVGAAHQTRRRRCPTPVGSRQSNHTGGERGGKGVWGSWQGRKKKKRLAELYPDRPPTVLPPPPRPPHKPILPSSRTGRGVFAAAAPLPRPPSPPPPRPPSLPNARQRGPSPMVRTEQRRAWRGGASEWGRAGTRRPLKGWKEGGGWGGWAAVQCSVSCVGGGRNHGTEGDRAGVKGGGRGGPWRGGGGGGLVRLSKKWKPARRPPRGRVAAAARLAC